MTMPYSENNNQLENFLRKHLQGYRSAENGWNEPPDEVWEQVARKLAPKRRFVFSIWLKLGLLTLVISSLIGYQFFKYNEKLDDVVVHIEATNVVLGQALEKVQREVDELKEGRKEFVNTKAINSKKASKKNILIPPINLKKSTPLKESPIILIDKDEDKVKRYSLSEKLSYNSTTIIEKLKEPIRVRKGELATIKKERIDWEIPFLKTHRSTTINFASSPLAIEANLWPTKKKVLFSYLKLVTSKLQTKQILKNIPSDYTSTSEHKYYGFSVGLRIGWQLSKKWTIESGVDYFNFSSDNHHFHHYTYTADQEILNEAGFLESSQNFILNSAAGSASTELFFNRNPLSNVNNDQEINLEIFSKTKIQYLQIPILLGYNLTTGRVGISLRAGFMYSLALHNGFGTTAIDMMSGPFSYAGNDSGKLTGLQKIDLSYLTGIALEYRFTPRWSISLEPTYSRNITLQAITKEDIQIYLGTIGFYGGVKLRF